MAEPVETEPPRLILQRWEDAGALWRVIARHGDQVTVSLRQCTGGEEVSRITSSDPDLLTFLAGRTSSED